ncbi:hypothetical protein DKX38_001706 [Salix brachista]|uniref:Uncharacterized protein n=1 Tax=Salix brachista TaxID=2182728 RepID=A0A5N5P4I8_9ROSI|nr:hypothetical protein DKX38_001706 [Salix brachista]
MVLQDRYLHACRHESLFIGDIVEEVRKKLDSTALLASCIDWHRYRLLVKKTKMIVSILSKIGVLILVGLFLYLLICVGIYLLQPSSDLESSFNGENDRVWKEAHSPDEMLKDFGIELHQSAGTKKYIDIGIKVMCSLVLAFFLS